MLAILHRESSIHARTLRCCLADRSGAIQRCFRARPRGCVPSEMSFFQKGNTVHSFVACRYFYMRNCLSSTYFASFFSKLVTFSVHDVNNEMFSERSECNKTIIIFLVL